MEHPLPVEETYSESELHQTEHKCKRVKQDILSGPTADKEENSMLKLIETITQGLAAVRLAADDQEPAGINKLPVYILLHILSLCDEVTLLKCRRVCRSWFLLARDMYVWRGKTLKPLNYQAYFSSVVQFTDEHLLQMMVYAPHITHLDLESARGVSLEGILQALRWSKYSHNITRINFPVSTELEESFLMELATLCPRLENMCIFHEENAKLLQVVPRFQNIKELEVVQIGDCDSSDEALVRILKSCRSLVTLRMLLTFSAQTVQKIVDHCPPTLTSLSIDFDGQPLGLYTNVYQLGMLRHLKSLKVIALEETDDEFLLAISHCTQLTFLSLERCVFDEFSGFKSLLEKLTKLESLSLEDTNANSQIFLDISEAGESLKELNIKGCYDITRAEVQMLQDTLTDTNVHSDHLDFDDF